MSYDRSQVAAALAIAGVAPVIFSLSGEKLISLRQTADDSESRTKLRHAQLVGGAVVMALGSAAAIATKESAYFVGAALATGAMAAIYQHAITNPKRAVAPSPSPLITLYK